MVIVIVVGLVLVRALVFVPVQTFFSAGDAFQTITIRRFPDTAQIISFTLVLVLLVLSLP